MDDGSRFYTAMNLHLRSYDSLLDPVPPQLRGDLEFYLALARETPGPVLEIGAGTGRISLELAAAGLWRRTDLACTGP